MERQSLPERTETLGAPPHGRSALPVFTSRFSTRKSFQPRRNLATDEDAAVTSRFSLNAPVAAPPSPVSSESSFRAPSPIPPSRIPRPSSSQSGSFASSRRSFGLAEAYRMAEAEENVIPGSPSPAPRLPRSRRDPGENGIQSILKQRPLNIGRRRSSRQSDGSVRDDESMASSASGEERLYAAGRDPMQRERDRERMEHATRAGNGLFSKAKLGPKVTETGRELSRKASNSSLNGSSPGGGPRSWGLMGKAGPNFAKKLMASPDSADSRVGADTGRPTGLPRLRRDVAVPSIEVVASSPAVEPPELRPGTAPPVSRSPNKSFAWQADADFTAGDLQVSASPPVKVTKPSKLDELKAFRPRNTKLDEIMRREAEVAKQFPDELGSPDDVDEADGVITDQVLENERSLAKNRLADRTNTKLDEIRAREIESLSKRALATSRLDEIRERNSEFRAESRSLSPEASRKPSSEPIQEPTPSPEKGRVTERPILEYEEGERIPDTPVTIFRGTSNDHRKRASPSTEVAGGQDGKGNQQTEDPVRSRMTPSHSRGDSQDILRRLARAASASPSLEEQASKSQSKGFEPASGADAAASRSDGAEKKPGREPDAPQARPLDQTKALIGSAALRRAMSTDSVATSSKRSSVVNSESDPTDRIEAEMLLFAPMGDQSEKGSTRAASPGVDEDEDEDRERDVDEDVEETPRAVRQDPLTMPTPKVTGAYVETPVTVKVENADAAASRLPSQRSHSQSQSRPQSQSLLSAASHLRSRGQLNPGPSGKSDEEPGGRSSSVSLRRRARSLPRARSPLINSVKLPSAKDDLLEIQRLHQVDDSTLDDFDDLLTTHDLDMSDSDAALKSEGAVQTEATRARPADTDEDFLDRGLDQLEAFERMSRSLQTGLLGIQTAKKGIERLEDQVSQAEAKAAPATMEPQPHHPHHMHDSATPVTDCPLCHGLPPKPAVTYVHFPVPRLYYREPKFRLSILGILLLLAGLWLAGETAMCARFCRPTWCGPGDDCRWSPDDPFFGHAIPVKLDQWVTGGRGRVLAEHLGQEAGDLLVEAWDFVLRRDIADVDIQQLDWAQRRRHRRRLMKRGLIKPWTPPPEQKANLEAWARARLERERADEAREMGYDIGDGLGDDSMHGDEKVSL